MLHMLVSRHCANNADIYEGRFKSSWTHLITPSRCGDGLFFKVPPLASDALLTTLHPLLENVLQTVDHFEISCLGAPFLWLEEPRNLMGRDMDCMADVLMGFHRSTFSKPNTEFNLDLVPWDLWVFPTVNRELRGKKFRSGQRHAARFRKVGRSGSLAKGGTSKKRPSPYFHEVPTWSNKVSQ
jgi:hypothetical protein